MESSFFTRLKSGWNAFLAREPTHDHIYDHPYRNIGTSFTYRPDRVRFSRGNERSIVTSVFNQIAMDVAAVDIKHCRLDENGRYISDMKSGLNECLNLEANIDQTGRAFIQDVVMSMLDEGAVAIVAVDTSVDPRLSNSYDILSLRTGKIIEWFPAHVKVKVYNERTGQKEDITLPKRQVAIIENPLYAVINEPNSTMQRLIRKLNLLDAIDEQSGSGKLDLIIQLPYTIKSELRQQQADKRRKDIEEQLKGPFGIAYTDATERITQLNRPVENNLMKQIEYLTSQFYGQLGITQAVMDGTADERTMLNYNNRTIEPILSAIVDAMRRVFLTKTARSQGQTITFFRNPFKLVAVADIANMADTFTRNEILSSNEFRQILGFKPSDDPKADQLVNSNIAQPADAGMMPMEEGMEEYAEEPIDETGEVETDMLNAPVGEISGDEVETDLLNVPVSELSGITTT